MSEILGRTWNYLTSSVTGAGPRWTVPSAQNNPTAHLPPGLAQFLQNVTESTTKRQEEELVSKQLEAIQMKLKEPKLKTTVIADCIVRAMFCEILGYSVKFAHFYAVELAEKGSILEKKMGYLACTIFLRDSDELILLLINTIVKDLKSHNMMEVSIALTAAVHLTPKDMAPMLLPIVLEKTTHSKEFIRKKSLICLQHMVSNNPTLSPQIESCLRRCLADKDPGVVAAAIQVLNDIVDLGAADRLMDLVDSLIGIQEQILEGKLPTDYVFKGIMAPWMQIDILKLLTKLVRKRDLQQRKPVIALVQRSMDSITSKENIALAVVYQCILSIADLQSEDDPSTVSRCLSQVSRFLQSKHNNVKYMGLSALEALFKRTPPMLSDQQETCVLNCLSHPDSSIQRKTLSLLYVLANRDNVKTICGKLAEFIKDSDDAYQTEDLIRKAVALADKFSVSLDWYVSVLLRLLQSSGGETREQLMRKTKTVLTERNPEDEATVLERNRVGLKLRALLTRLAGMTTPSDSPSDPPSGPSSLAPVTSPTSSSDTPSSSPSLIPSSSAPSTVLRLLVWTESHFFHLDTAPEAALTKIVGIGQDRISDPKHEATVTACLEAIFSVCTSTGCEPSDPVVAFVNACFSSESVMIQDAAEELLWILPHIRDIHEGLDGVTDPSDDTTMSYVDELVVTALEKGSRPYVPINFREAKRIRRVEAPALRFTPYNILEEQPVLKERSGKAKSELSSTDQPREPDEAATTVWSLEGRIKSKMADDDHTNQITTGEVTTTQSPLVSDLEAVVQDDLANWKE